MGVTLLAWPVASWFYRTSHTGMGTPRRFALAFGSLYARKPFVFSADVGPLFSTAKVGLVQRLDFVDSQLSVPCAYFFSTRQVALLIC